MDGATQQALVDIITQIEPHLYWMLFKACAVFFFTILLTNSIKSLAIYVRLRFSDLIAKRTVIEYDGFRGVIEEISMNGVFIKNANGDTKFVPITRWNFGSIIYPNNISGDSQ